MLAVIIIITIIIIISWCTEVEPLACHSPALATEGPWACCPLLSLAGPSKMFHRPPSPHIHSLTPALLSYGLPATLSHPIVALSLSGPGFPGHHPSGVSWQKGLPSTQPLPPTPAGPPPGLESDWVL